MAKKKLLIVTTTAETLVTILNGQARYLSAWFEVAVSCAADTHLPALRDDEAAPVYVVPMSRGISPLADLRSIADMVRVMRQFKPDIVHSYTPKAGLVAMAAGWLCRVPIRVHTFTGLIFPSASGLKRKLLIAVDALIARLATVVVPESEGVRKDLAAHRIAKRPHDLIGHGNIAGVDTAFFSAKLPEVAERAARIKTAELADARFAFCYVGRINRDKGIPELMQAFRDLPADTALLMIGELDATAPPPAEVLERLEADPRIHLLGFQRDVRAFIAAADVLVLPSYREGFPNVVLQALSLERPVIVTDVSGANEITLPGSNGWIVPVRDAEALRGAMEKALGLGAPALARMGEQGRERVALRHERSLYLERLREFYQSL